MPTLPHHFGYSLNKKEGRPAVGNSAPQRVWRSKNLMSALGQKQTSRHVRVMSVVPLKADIHQRALHVR